MPNKMEEFLSQYKVIMFILSGLLYLTALFLMPFNPDEYLFPLATIFYAKADTLFGIWAAMFCIHKAIKISQDKPKDLAYSITFCCISAIFAGGMFKRILMVIGICLFALMNVFYLLMNLNKQPKGKKVYINGESIEFLPSVVSANLLESFGLVFIAAILLNIDVDTYHTTLLFMLSFYLADFATILLYKTILANRKCNFITHDDLKDLYYDEDDEIILEPGVSYVYEKDNVKIVLNPNNGDVVNLKHSHNKDASIDIYTDEG